jgi:hypothetical protein
MMRKKAKVYCTKKRALSSALMPAFALLMPMSASVAFADTSLHQATPIDWEDYMQECSGDEDLDPGEVLWHFVLISSGCSSASGDLTATFSGCSTSTSPITQGADKCSGGVLHWNIVTDDSCVLEGASTPVDGTLLNLSHVCPGDEQAPPEYFCTLTQGCLGARNSVCNCATPGCNESFPDDAEHLGYIWGSGCLPVMVGDGDGNTITIKDDGDLCALLVELPAKGTAGQLNETNTYSCTATKSGKDWTVTGTVPDDWSASSNDQNLGGTEGQGGGVLTGHKLAAVIAQCLVGRDAFSVPASPLSDYTIPADECTTRAGEDKVVGTGDDVCECFTFPDCVQGKTAAAVIDCANEQLGTGSNSCGCSAGDLATAMGAVNNMFDNCGRVVESCE